jgi:RNA polymerase sigma-70 factor (ECF subfamily)
MVEITHLSCQQNEENGLVRAAVDGDRSAFDQLVRLHSPRVYRVALAMLGNREDAADVQQEAFLQAYKKLRSFRGQSSFGTWIHAITARLCLMRRRKVSYRYEELGEDVLLQSGGSGLSPENAAIAAESAERVRRVLGKMTPNDRLLIVLKYVEQLDHKEIAGVLGCSEESSRSRLARAKKLFRGIYGEME